MVRSHLPRPRPPRGFPHIRGDGPLAECRCFVSAPFSPHTWGWSVQNEETGEEIDVFPTYVGMVRLSNKFGLLKSSFPHIRGDGPRALIIAEYIT